jgi:hypothetical protein
MVAYDRAITRPIWGTGPSFESAFSGVQDCSSATDGGGRVNPANSDLPSITGEAIERLRARIGIAEPHPMPPHYLQPNVDAFRNVAIRLDWDEGFIGEVKNVERQCLTSQIKDDIAFAKKNDLVFKLWVGADTVLSGPLADQVMDGNVELEIIPNSVRPAFGVGR